MTRLRPLAGGRELGPRVCSDELLALVDQVKSGNNKAIRTLVSALGPSVLRVVRRVLGAGHPEEEDIAQEAIFSMLEALPQFRADCTVLHFACRVAVLTAMNARRRQQVREKWTEPADEHWIAEAAEPTPDDNLQSHQLRQLLRELLDELPAPQAEVLALHCVLGYTIAETAAACGAPINTVRGRLNTAKSALRQRLQAQGRIEEVQGVS